jgi:hypothetical protein
MQTTVQAIKRISEIKQRREHAFWKSRSVSSYSIVSFAMHVTDIPVQNGGKSTEKACKSEKENIHEAGPTHESDLTKSRKDPLQSQDLDTSKICASTGRRPVHGNGSRLTMNVRTTHYTLQCFRVVILLYNVINALNRDGMGIYATLALLVLGLVLMANIGV